MKKLFTLLLVAFATVSNAQTLVYSTGQTYMDDWTGWTTPVTSGVVSQMFSANTWTFGVSGSYSIETTRAFSINSQDLDIYWAASTQNADIEVLHSLNGSTWTSVQTQNYGAGFQQQTMVIPTYNPQQQNFYLKLKMTGTAGSPPSAIFNNFYINADLGNPFTSGVEDLSLGKNLIFFDHQLQVLLQDVDYTVTIYNINGEIIATQRNMKSFDMNNFQAGLYFVNVTDAQGHSKTLKIAQQ